MRYTEALEEDDEAPFSDKKKSKIKLPFSTKKIMKSVGLKDKDKPSTASTATSSSTADQPSAVSRSVSEPGVARVHHEPSAEVAAKMQESDEWKAFQAMQERISQVVSRTSEKVTQMEHGFETELSRLDSASCPPWTELSRLTAASASSPWTVVSDGGASPPGGSAAGNDDQKNSSSSAAAAASQWIGFDDAFHATQPVTTADDITQADDSEQQQQQQQVDSNQQVDEQVSNHVSDESSPAPRDRDVITTDTQQPAAEAGGDVAMATNDAEVVDEETIDAESQQERQTMTPTQTDDTAASAVAAGERAGKDDVTADPFDVSNVVSAMTSGKPIFEALPSDAHKPPASAAASGGRQEMTAQERRERDRQITAALIGADDNEAVGARTRPRPRPQAGSMKSANPFKITLAASSIEPADNDAYDDVDDENAQRPAATTTFSAGNPFARTGDWDEAETADAQGGGGGGVWDHRPLDNDNGL